MTGVNPVRRIYVIRNGRVAPEWKSVKPRTLSIAGRAVSTLIKNQGIGDLYELYAFSKRNGADYNLAVIPGDFPDTSTSAFDPKYMTSLFDVGFRMAQAGYPWKKIPPRLGETHQAATPAPRPKPKPPAEPNISAAPDASGGAEPAPQAASYY